jgi:hypothetical protein
MIGREVTVWTGLCEPAPPLGGDKPPAVLDEFAPSIPLGARDGELGLKLGVNRLVVEDNSVGALVWLASGAGERMDRGGHPEWSPPGCSGGLPRGLATRTARVVTMRR